MKAIVVTDQAAGTAGMKLVERSGPVHVEDAALATVEITWRGKTVYTSVWQEQVQLRTNRR